MISDMSIKYFSLYEMKQNKYIRFETQNRCFSSML